MGKQNGAQRRYDFDALRGIGALCVVAAHCATLFTNWSTGLSGLPANRWIAEIAWLLNPWLMSLFMLLAGASMWYGLRNRSVAAFVRERALRILPPVACATLIIVPVMMYLGRLYSGVFQGSFWRFYPLFFSGVYPQGEFSFLHFWFLVYLLLYTFMALPLCAALRTVRGQAFIGRAAAFVARPGRVYILALPLLALQLALWAAWPQPDLPVLVNDWTRFGQFFCLFMYGYIMMSDPRFGRALAGEWRRAGLLVVLTSSALFAIGAQQGFNPFRDLPRDYSWSYIGFNTVFVACAWSWLIFLLGFGQRYLNVPRPLLAYTGSASYGIYLLHPLVWPLMGVWFSGWETSPLARFGGLFACVLAGTLVLYEIVRRCHPVCVVFGLKPAAGLPVLPWATPGLPVAKLGRPVVVVHHHG